MSLNNATERSYRDHEPSLFTPAGFVLVRTPLLPLDALRPWLAAGAADSESDGAKYEGISATRSFLREMIADPVVQEALLAASPDLFRAIPRWEREPDGKRGRRAEIKLLRYVLRMATRPTPFGLFAGVARGQIGATMDVRVDDIGRHRKRTRPDLQWLLQLVLELERRPAVVSAVPFFTNTASFVLGGRLYLPSVDAYGQGKEERVASLRATTVVLETLALAREGATLEALQQQLQHTRPDAPPSQVRALLDGLREQGALLSGLRPPLTGGDALVHLLDQIEGLPGCEDVRDRLCKVRDLASAYDALPLGNGLAVLQALYGAMAIPDADIRSPLAVDLVSAVSGEHGTPIFAEAVAEEVVRAGELVLRLSTAPTRLPHLAAYRREFHDRYGEGEAREVPLLELLDEMAGLGPPPTYQHPPRHSEPTLPPPPQHQRRARELLALAVAAARDGQREVVLDKETLDRIVVNESWREEVPESFDLYVSIAARDEAAIATGDYLVVLGPRLGDLPAGRSFGRFADLLGPPMLADLTGLARDDEARQPDQIFAELVYLPPSGHAANVAVRPATRRHEVVIAATPGVARMDTIALDDLVVSVRGDRFRLRSVSRDADVMISNTHLLNYSSAPNACRFLSEVALEGHLRPTFFDWGSAAQLPFLPRLRVGRAVLQPAEWHLPTELIGADTSLDDAAGDALAEWCARWRVPRHIYMVDADARLLLDLENPLSVDDLLAECRRRAPGHASVTLQEVLPALDGAWGGARGRYMHEFVVPLVRRIHTPSTTVRRESLPRYSPIHASMRLKLTGSDWLYAKLYCGRTRQEDLLGGPLRDFASAAVQAGLAGRWFFIRYADPEPHVRLRFHGQPGTLLTELLPEFVGWCQDLVDSGFIRTFTLDGYDREIERYLGPVGIGIAERIFAVDSIAVADLCALHTRRVTELSGRDLAVLTVDDLLGALGLGKVSRLNLYRAIRQGQERSFGWTSDRSRAFFHEYRRTAQRLVGDRNWLREQAGGEELRSCLQRRAEALRDPTEDLRLLSGQTELASALVPFFASIVHMHCNRVLGVDRPLEFEVMCHLERTLESMERFVPPGIQLA